MKTQTLSFAKFCMALILFVSSLAFGLSSGTRTITAHNPVFRDLYDFGGTYSVALE